jgi:hypothetical protein
VRLGAAGARVAPDLLGVGQPGQRGGDALADRALEVGGDLRDRERGGLVVEALGGGHGQGGHQGHLGRLPNSLPRTPPVGTP